jgi:branched-chain amino acid transport system permease protein
MISVLQSTIDALSLGGLYAVFALGIAFIFGIMRLINFAHGELIMIGAYVAVFLSDAPVALMLVAMITIVVIAALAMERVAFRPVRGADPATLLITSFAVSYLVQNLAIMTVGAFPKSVNILPSLSQPIEVGDLSISRVNLVTIAVVSAVLATLGIGLRRTRLGVQMRAAAEDFQMARVLGVRANRAIALAFAISGVLAAVAAFLLVLQTGQVSPSIGVNPVLIAFAATIVGGLGSLSGAVLGGMLLGAATVLFQLALPLSLRPFRDAFTFALVFCVLIIRPQGLIVVRSLRTRV